jgi:hypothetical protein
VLDELGEDHLTLSVNLACLDRARYECDTEDRCAAAALRSIDRRLTDLAYVRDALAGVQLAAATRSVQRAFLPDAPLADYVRGVYAWMHAVVRAFDRLVSELAEKNPSWPKYRARIEEAKNFHFDELGGAIRADLASLRLESGDDEAVRLLRKAFEGLLNEAVALEATLDDGLG